MNKRDFHEIRNQAVDDVDAALREAVQQLIDDPAKSKELQWCYGELLEHYHHQRSEQGIFGVEEWSVIEEAFNEEFGRSEE